MTANITSLYQETKMNKCGLKYIGDDQIWESRTVKFLALTIDNELKYDEDRSNICKKAQGKLTVLTRIKNT